MVKAGFHSLMVIPIIQDKKTFAHISFSSVQVGVYTDEDRELLTSVARHLAPAIRNATLFQEAEKRASRLSVLNELNRKISANHSLDETLESVVRAVVELLGSDHCRLFLVDPSDRSAHLRASFGQLSDESAPHAFYSFGEGALGWTIEHGVPLNIPDVLKDGRWLGPGWAKSRDVRSCICHPLRVNNTVVGAISTVSSRVGFFKDEDLELLDSLSSQAAIGIDKSSLFDEIREHAERQEITAKIAKAVGSTLEPEKLFKAIIQEIRKFVPCERYFISTLDESLAHHWYGESEIDVEPYAWTDIANSSHWGRDVYRKNRLVNVPNLRENSSSRARVLAGAGFQSAIAVPILQDDRCIAHLSLTSTKPGAFTPEHENFLTSISAHLGSAIRNVSLYKAAKKRAMRFAILNELNKKITENLDLQDVLSSFAMSTVHLVNAGHVQIFLLDGASSRLTLRVSSGGVYRPEMDDSLSPPEEGMAEYVFQEEKPIVSSNMQTDSRFKNPEWLKRRGFHAYIGQPIRRSGETIGVISCFSQPEGFFSNEDLELLGALASQAAIAIQNAGVHLELKDSLEELRRSQEMIVRAEKLSSLGVLAAGAAHEILNPASVIQIRAEMTREKSRQGSKENKNSRIILQNVERIRKICDNLRRFSREENTRHRLFSLEYLIRETVDLFDHEFRPGNIEVKLNLDYEVSMIRGELHHIQQVFVILFANSRDAMPDGGRISICSRDAVIDGKVWRKVSISDTGQGISDSIKSKIFDPFFTTKSEDEGTGLGLSVLHGIMENHHGTVQVESVEGKGTTFVICLPTAEGYSHSEEYSDIPRLDETGQSSLAGNIPQ